MHGITLFPFSSLGSETNSGPHITPTWKIFYYLHSSVYLLIFFRQNLIIWTRPASSSSSPCLLPWGLGFFSLPLCIFPGTKYLLDVISLKKCKRIQDYRAFVATHILCCFTLLTLGVSGKVFLKRLDGGGYTHPKCGQLYPLSVVRG